VSLAGTDGAGLIVAGMSMLSPCRMARYVLFHALQIVVLLIGVPSIGKAADIRVLLSDDSAPYQEAYEAIRAGLQGLGHDISRIDAGRFAPGELESASLIVAVGVRATESLFHLSSRPPLLVILVPREWYLKSAQPVLSGSGAKPVSVIYVDQPFDRQARLIRLAFPEARRVGLVIGEKREALVSKLQAELRRQGLSLEHEKISTDRELIGSLERVLPSSDLLLALPDPVAFNRNTAQSIFLTAYRYRDPVLGYSSSLTRAGALLSLYSTPAQVGRQATEWIRKAGQGEMQGLPPPSHPDYFSVSINNQVARSLGIKLPAEAELVRELGRLP
jgi:putative tryptophan/tyrosine transport system substrate-binding protein